MSRCTYQVFLSFRDLDLKNFIDHLHTALEQAGIYTFKNEYNLERREHIKAEIIKAIKGSNISIIVLSQNYASTVGCLDELVMIMKRRNKAGRHVLPIFYDIDPSQVRHQTGSYAIAFNRHKIFYKHRVEGWRAALREVADLGGMALNNRHESQFIQDIVIEIKKMLHQPARNNKGRTISSKIAGIWKIFEADNLNSGRVQKENVQELENYAVYKAKDKNVQELENYGVYKAKDTTKSVNNYGDFVIHNFNNYGRVDKMSRE